MTIWLGLLLAAAAAAQTPAPTPAPAPDATRAIVNDAAPVPPTDYAYTPEGRRDPFVSLVNRGVDRGARVSRSRVEGPGGLLIDEIVVRGILQSRNEWVAMVTSPGGRTVTVRPGDRVMDGVVRTITAHAVIFDQDVDDPLSLDKQREVRKALRGEVK